MYVSNSIFIIVQPYQQYAYTKPLFFGIARYSVLPSIANS